MDHPDCFVDILSMTSLLLVLLLRTQHALEELSDVDPISEEVLEWDALPDTFTADSDDEELVQQVVLNQFRLWTTLLVFDEDLGFWVKPRSTTWFSKFLLEEYDDDRWLSMFRMNKAAVLALAELLSPTIRKKDTNYRCAVPVTVRVACTLFKLSHGVSLMVCSELFAVGKSTISSILQDVVHAVNTILRPEIKWPTGDAVLHAAVGFRDICGLPGAVGAIDGTHFAISKPKVGATDYYYFKTGGYSMACQAVVDTSKRFLDLTVGMPGSTNDSRVLRRSALYHKGQNHLLWDRGLAFNGFSLYLLGDSGYPLLSWIMVPHRASAQMPVVDALFNKRLSRGRAVVENAFALLKKTFRELHVKSQLHVIFLPDVVVCCALLHNMLQRQSQEDVARLLDILGREPALVESAPEVQGERPQLEAVEDNDEVAVRKRRELGRFLAIQRALLA